MISIELMTRLRFFRALSLSVAILTAAPCFAKGGGGGHRGGGSSRPSYGGGHHTESHGGTFKGGGGGSSHKGGEYKNPKTGDQYGKHK